MGALEVATSVDLEKNDELEPSQAIPGKNMDVAPMEEDLGGETLVVMEAHQRLLWEEGRSLIHSLELLVVPCQLERSQITFTRSAEGEGEAGQRPRQVKLIFLFKYGYLKHAGAFYVSDVDEDGARKEVTTELVSSWDLNWQDENAEFKRFLRADKELKALSGKLFYVYDGNHRLKAWKRVIETLHQGDDNWYHSHGGLACVILDCSGGRGDILNAMHEINK